MIGRIQRGIAVLVATAALMVAVSCSVQVTEPPPDPSTAPAEHTQYFVDQAVAYYKAHGLDATIAFYNSMKSVDGEWYVFIVDEDNVMISHATIPKNVGQSFHDIVGSGGYPVGSLIIGAATEAGAWIDYTYINPAAEAIQWKHTWAVRHDGLLFGSGWYEEGASKTDPAAFTQAFVDQAVRLYDVLGLEGTIAFYNTPESIDGDWYVFIGDENEIMLAHAAVPENVGLHFDDVLGRGGYPAGAQAAAAATAAGLVDNLHVHKSGGGFIPIKALMGGAARRSDLRLRLVRRGRVEVRYGRLHASVR